MYRIAERGGANLIGLVEKVRYITYDAASGMFFQAFGAQDADGVAVGGVPYNFGDEEKIPDAPFVDISEIDGGEYLFSEHNEVVKNTDEIDELQQLILEQDNELCLTQEAVMKLDNQINGGE